MGNTSILSSLMPALKLLGWRAGPVSLGEAGGGFPALPPPWCGRVARVGWRDAALPSVSSGVCLGFAAP